MRSELAAVLLLPLFLACTWDTDLPPEARAIAVEPARELLIRGDTLEHDGVAANRSGGPLSFAGATAALHVAPLAWLRGWAARLAAEGHAERSAALSARVTCPWLRRRPANGCTPDCSSCTEETLEPGEAPFRLVAVVNRTDLAAEPDRTAEGGEGRLAFTLTDGAADDPTSAPLPVAVILEYAQRGPAGEWARRWHELASGTDEAWSARVARTVAPYVGAGDLAQLRTADALGGPLLFHELHLAGGALVPVAPPPSQDCAGCHARSPTGFHLDPAVPALVSPFVTGELERRAAFLQVTLAGQPGIEGR